MKALRLLALASVLSVPLVPGRAATPIWKDEPQTTFASYTFTTSSQTPLPEQSRNAYGTPMLSVAPGSFSTGWQDPYGEFQLTRVSGQGAWDLANYGTMTLVLPFAPALGAPFDLDVFIDCVWYQGPVSQPSLGVAERTPTSLTTSQEILQSDGAGSWRRTNWSATFEDVSAHTITVTVTAPANGSVVDSLTVYTRYVPEPATAGLLLFGSCLVMFTVSRNREEKQTYVGRADRA